MLDLFSQSGLSGAVVPVDTRRDAHEAVSADNVATISAQIEQLLRVHGGLTDEELVKLIGRRMDSIRPRRCELRDKGIVVDSGLRRPTTAGFEAIVWTLAENAAEPNDVPCRRCKSFERVRVETANGHQREDCGRCGAFQRFTRWSPTP